MEYFTVLWLAKVRSNLGVIIPHPQARVKGTCVNFARVIRDKESRVYVLTVVGYSAFCGGWGAERGVTCRGSFVWIKKGIGGPLAWRYRGQSCLVTVAGSTMG